MIFVTVGTHEQPFDRLVKCVDELVAEKIIKEKVIIQKGYSKYTPKYCNYYDLIEYERMNSLINEARIVITHGGPASFIAPISVGKIPIVVPRKKEYNEHVNNHQLEFAKIVKERMNNIILADNEEEIKNSILNYNDITKELVKEIYSNNQRFNEQLKDIIDKMFM